eukprot:9703653-Lingulodinium_polyedra.AAC.1
MGMAGRRAYARNRTDTGHATRAWQTRARQSQTPRRAGPKRMMNANDGRQLIPKHLIRSLLG